MYDNGTVFINASKPNERAILAKMRTHNNNWKRKGSGSDYYAVLDDPRAPLVHELGHLKHEAHVKSHAKKTGITYAESKRRFNGKLLEMLEREGYNIGRDISGYAKRHHDSFIGELNASNEIISESFSKAILKNNKKAKKIIKLLEREEW